jgi:hypothetical protein
VKWCVVALALACCWVAGAQATTAPGVLFISKLVLTDGAIQIRGDKFMTPAGIPRYPRGTDVRYEVWNRGTRPLTLDILGSSTGRLRPGKRTTILVYWARRGKFAFRARPSGPQIRIWVD